MECVFFLHRSSSAFSLLTTLFGLHGSGQFNEELLQFSLNSSLQVCFVQFQDEVNNGGNLVTKDVSKKAWWSR